MSPARTLARAAVTGALVAAAVATTAPAASAAVPGGPGVVRNISDLTARVILTDGREVSIAPGKERTGVAELHWPEHCVFLYTDVGDVTYRGGDRYALSSGAHIRYEDLLDTCT